MKKLMLIAATVLVVVCMSFPVAAQDTGKDWQFKLAPLYMWAVFLDGSQTVKGQEAQLDVNFGDIWDNLGGVFTVHFEGVYRQQWGIFTDYSYVDIDIDGTLGPGVNVEVDYQMTYFELGGYYRFQKDVHDFDILAGIRYTDMDATINLGPSPNLEGKQDWTDPIVGVRWTWHFADRWELWLRGDIGGFGVGSDFTWNAIGMLQFQPWKHVSLFGGYRALYQDYEDGSGADLFKYDVTTHGPVLGLNITW